MPLEAAEIVRLAIDAKRAKAEAARAKAIQLAKGEQGIPGKDGKDGADGKDGRDGIDGKDGAPGRDGIDGKDGAPGRDGRDGVDGADGKDGRDGKDGKDGADGSLGKSWRGQWERGTDYKQGEVVGWRGSSWIAESDTNTEPGGTGGAWGIVAAKGRDGVMLAGGGGSSGGTGGAVDSVNGQTGTVVLDADDVGADAEGTADAAIAAHVAASDPHTGYQKESEKDAANGYLGADSNARLALSKLEHITTDRLLGRDTAGTGAVEQISLTGGLEFNGSGRIQTGAFTGDVTKSAGGTALTLANSGVSAATYGDSITIPQVAVDAKGRITSASGVAVRAASTSQTGVVELASNGEVASGLAVQSNDWRLDVAAAATTLNAAVSVASVTPVDLMSTTMDLAAGDIVEIVLWGSIVNGSGGSRSYTVTWAIGALTASDTTDAGWSSGSTGLMQITLRVVVGSAASTRLFGQTYGSALISSGSGGGTIGANLCLNGFNASASDFAGSQTLKIQMNSNNATGTQEFTVDAWHARKINAP